MRQALLAALAAAALVAAVSASAAGGVKPDRMPEADVTDLASLQSGARTFVNYCLNCHGASLMRYNALREIGLTEEQIQQNLMFTAEKVGMPMSIAMSAKDAKEWFGTAPPDLSVIARSRGADWLYTYLRTFYRDAATPTGWNNKVYSNVGMPHVLWQLQGTRGATVETVRADRHPETEKVTGYTKTTALLDRAGVKTETAQKLADGKEHGEGVTVTLAKPEAGQLSAAQYDKTVYELVSFLVWMGEPHQLARKRLGVWVLFGLAVLIFFAYSLKLAYWKDVH